jgi:O-antigen/teichoic acid export membrane protein
MRLFREYRWAMGAEFIGLLLGALAPAIAAHRWGADGFGEYQILYRGLALLQPPLLVGLGVAVPRFIARARGRAPNIAAQASETIVVVALAIEVAVLAAMSACVAPARGYWAHLLLGKHAAPSASLVLIALVASSCIWALSAAYLRGVLRMRRANGLVIWYIGVAPLLAILSVRSVHGSLLCLSALWLSGGLIAVSPWQWRPVIMVR